MTEETNWIPGLVAGGIGLSIGLIAAWRLRAAPSERSSLTRRDQEAEWDTLKAQLIEAQAAERNDPQQAHHRYALEQRAALLLKERQMADLSPPETEDAPESKSASPKRASWIGAAWGALATAAILVPLIIIQNHSSERVEGGSITGNTGPAGGPSGAPTQQSTPPMKSAPDPTLQPLRDAVEANPEAVEPRLTLLRAQIGRRRFIQAYEGANELLKFAPDNAQAKTFLAIVRIEMGMSSTAVKLLTEALQTNPILVEALIYRGVANMQTGEAQAALDDWAEATTIRPDAATVLKPLIERAEGMLNGTIQPPKPKAHPPANSGMPSGHPPTGSRMPSGHPPAGAISTTQAPKGPPAKLVINLAEGAQAKTGEILFIIGRPAGVSAGPPAAVKRLTVGTFPIEVSLTNADMMMGGTLPEKLDITARVDGDGNPLTKNDGVRGEAKSVAVGGSPAALTLAPMPAAAP